MDSIELLSLQSFDCGSVTEVIRPAARINEWAVRILLEKLALNDVRNGGHWYASPSLWERYDRPWTEMVSPGEAELQGGMQIAYGTPTKYEITVYRVTITQVGAAGGWTVQTLSDEALGFAGLTLATCPRVELAAPPKVFLPR